MRITPPGDDVVPVPPPLDESPPYDRFCDLVTTGGVASGVVYPWAIVEIARAYRFRSIGGTSVGAMAAALAAAAEYGRRTGNDRAFEPLRRLPGALGETLPDGRNRILSLFQTNVLGRRLIQLWRRLGRGRILGRRTRMLSLFQTNPRGRRLLEVWRRLGRGRVLGDNEADPPHERRAMPQVARAAGVMWRVVTCVMRAYAEPLTWIALAAAAIGFIAWWLIGLADGGLPWLCAILLLVMCLACALVAFAWVLWRDERAKRRVALATGVMLRVSVSVARANATPLWAIALAAAAIGFIAWWLTSLADGGSPWLRAILLLVMCLAGALVAFAWVLWRDERAKRRVALATGVMLRVSVSVARANATPLWAIALAAAAIGFIAWWLTSLADGGSPWLRAILLLVMCLAGALVVFAWVLWRDVKEGVIDNNLGLCKGGTLEAPGPEGRRPGISEWLHEGIQASAGMKARDRPLTFRDLWCAPLYPGAEGLPCSEDDPPDRRSINLQMITTNVTHGRPYRLPMFDETSRLFYRATDLEGYFPKPIIDAMVKVSRPYRALSKSDAMEGPKTKGFLELPGADMPIVVAARLSLSYPLLFSAVPLWAIDYEREEGQRELKRCLFTDGGVSSNFPIHLFDAALPRWPTFGMWLDRLDPNGPSVKPAIDPNGPSAKPPIKAPPERSRSADGFTDAPEEQSERRDDEVWLPEPIGEGWSDSWKRFDPLAAYASSDLPPAMPVGLLPNLKFLAGFLDGILGSAIEWRDRTSFRLPHVRNRVARLMLRKGEGGLNIGMQREQILRMAHRYGTKTGLAFVERFADSEGQASRSWQEQRWMRMVLLVRGLRERLTNLRESIEWRAAGTIPIDEAIERAQQFEPLRDGARSQKLEPSEAEGMRKLLIEIRRMERSLRDLKPEAYKPLPDPELRLRAPL